MEPTNQKHLDFDYTRSVDAKRILECLKKMNQDVIASHKKSNTPIVVSIDGKIVHIKPEDL